MKQTKFSFCRICEAGCGLKIHIDNNRIQKIEADNEHVVSQGYACIKGLSLDAFISSPDRMTQPLKKVDGKFQEISWEQALSEIAAKLKTIHQARGGQSIAAYTGNPIGFSLWPNTVVQGFLKGFGSDKLFTVGTVDCSNKFAASDRMYGSFMQQTFPDIDNCSMLIAVGANPAISRMSFINLPHPMKRLQAIEKRGGEVVWVNPRNTESSKHCGSHLAIRPDTDVFFMLGFLNELITQGGVKTTLVEQYMQGYDALAALAKDWPLDKVARVTRIPAAVISSLVSRYIAADGAALYSSVGVNQGRFGTLAFWLQETINAISGNLDKRGSSLMGKPVVAFPDTTQTGAVSRINQTPYITSCIPTGILADEILTPGEGQVRALFVLAGNPALSCANSSRLADAFDDLELLVSIDLYRNETANHADYILPGLHFLERPDIPFFFMVGMGLMPKRYFHYTDAVLNAPGEARDEGLILRQIASRAGFPLFDSKLLQGMLNIGEKLAGLPGCKDGAAERFYGLIARFGKLGGLSTLRKKPHGQILTPNKPGDYFGEQRNKKQIKIQLAPAEFIVRAKQLDDVYQQEIKNLGLKLIGKRERFSHNSWTHNVEKFIKGSRQSNYLYIHPDDAAQRGLKESDMAQVCANGQCIQVPVKFDRDFMLGTVSIPHGWGHQQSDGLSIAKQTQGANVNVLASDGPNSIEPISGMSQLNGIEVEITAVFDDA